MKIESTQGSAAIAESVEIVRLVRAGDDAATIRLYELCQQRRQLTLRQLGPQDTDDCLADLFVAVLDAVKRDPSRPGSVREPERLAGFIQMVLRMKIAQIIQQRQKDRSRFVEGDTREMESDTFVAINDGTRNPEEAAIASQAQECASTTLHHLRPLDRKVLESYYVEEQPITVIAMKTGLRKNQVYLLKSRAKARARVTNKLVEIGPRRRLQAALQNVTQMAA